MNMSGQWSAVREDLRSQWQASARVRLGGWAILGILSIYGVLLAQDHADARRVELKQLEGELSRLRSLAREKVWPERAAEAERLSQALSSMAWSERDIGLTEAALQDWLRTVPARLGLKTRELSIARVESGKTDAGAAPAATAGSSDIVQALPPGHVLLRARISFDAPQRAALMVFLAECARSDRSLVVERFLMRGQPAFAEIDLRVLARVQETG
ncbi:hypothetical protein ASC95_26500 [Pelomonas sp. Root1217]|nr:hypothetical protein ASC95_26500 [Pelomonas sp. Root1217]